MVAPKYAQRFARLPRVLETLRAHPDGLPIGVLADEIGVPADELREDLHAFYTADINDLLLGLTRPDVLEFLGPEGDDADPAEAEVVRVVDARPADELGVEHLDARELGQVYAAARQLLDLEPKNVALKGALSALSEALFGNPKPLSDPASWNRPLGPLRRAVDEQLKARILYSRVWREGVIDRVVEPYSLLQTRRGWEVDAGPPDDDAKLRTYLVSHLRHVEVLDEHFDAPSHLERRLRDQRATTTVRVQIPHSARWAADFFTERTEIVVDDEYTSTLDLTLLPPVESRIGLLLLASGEESRVLEPAGLVASGPKLAAELLAHHRR